MFSIANRYFFCSLFIIQLCVGLDILTKRFDWSGIKFVVTATPGTLDIESFLQSVYELYADYVIKVNSIYRADRSF